MTPCHFEVGDLVSIKYHCNVTTNYFTEVSTDLISNLHSNDNRNYKKRTVRSELIKFEYVCGDVYLSSNIMGNAHMEPPSVNRQTDRQIRPKTLPFHNVNGWW